MARRCIFKPLQISLYSCLSNRVSLAGRSWPKIRYRMTMEPLLPTLALVTRSCPKNPTPNHLAPEENIGGACLIINKEKLDSFFDTRDGI